MAYVAVDKDNEETIFNIKPRRYKKRWICSLEDEKYVVIPKGSIEKLIGKKLTWKDEPVELKEEK